MIKPAKNVLSKLETLHNSASDRQISSLFESNSDRFDEFSAKCGDILFDYSKNNIDEETRKLLLELAEAANFSERRDAMYSGQHINVTEDRAVQHIALRRQSTEPMIVDGEDVIPGVQDVLSRMRSYSAAVRDGTISGKGGKFTDVVNIGIGGSDLGPVMVAAALAPYHDGPKTHFVSNVDGADIAQVLANVPAETTLFIVASKTFTTQETMTNAQTARSWFVEKCGEAAVKRSLHCPIYSLGQNR